MNQTIEMTRNASGTWNRRSRSPYSPGVSDVIKNSSAAAHAAADVAATANRRFAQDFFDRDHTRRCTPAKARQMPAVIDQITVTQLIGIVCSKRGHQRGRITALTVMKSRRHPGAASGRSGC